MHEANVNRGLPVPKCTDGIVQFVKFGRRQVQAASYRGDIVSDGGLLLLRDVDRRLVLIKTTAKAFVDDRRAARVKHTVRDIRAQQVFALACSNEDVTNHNAPRSDLLLQTGLDRIEPLASGPTLSRLETAATPEVALKLNELLVDTFIVSQKAAAGGRARPRCHAFAIARGIGACALQLSLRQQLLPATVCVCGARHAGLLAAPERSRTCQSVQRADQAAGGQAAQCLAPGAPNHAGRLGLLPAPSAAALQCVGIH